MALTSLHSADNALAQEHERLLLGLARASIRHGLSKGNPLPVDLTTLPTELTVKCATFVTLEKRGELRGCIGCLEALRPLAVDIATNAYAAAFRDSRFPPVSPNEIDELEIRISLLTPAEPIAFSSEADLLSQLVPGEDGLILEEGSQRGTFLPSVWESLPEPGEFLRHLKRKAGLPADYWSNSLKVYRYRSHTIGKR